MLIVTMVNPFSFAIDGQNCQARKCGVTLQRDGVVFFNVFWLMVYTAGVEVALKLGELGLIVMSSVTSACVAIEM